MQLKRQRPQHALSKWPIIEENLRRTEYPVKNPRSAEFLKGRKVNFVVRTVNSERRSKLYIDGRIYLYRASLKDRSSTEIQYASVLGSPTIKR